MAVSTVPTSDGETTSDERQLLAATVREMLQAQAPLALVREWVESADGHITGFERRFATDGWYAVGIPEHVGGAGGTTAEVAVVAEELGRAASPSAAWMATALAAPLLTGADDLAARVAGGSAATVVIGAGQMPDVWATPLELVDGRVSGSVRRVLAADCVDLLVVPVRDGARHGLAVIDSAVAGVTVTTVPLLDGTRSLGDVVLDRAVAGALVEPEPTAAGRLWRSAAVLIAADALGAAERMLQMTVAYTLQREQFGVPIASFQAVKHAAATMLVDIEPVRSVVEAAAVAVAGDDVDADLHACVAKAHATEAAVRVAEEALRLHGAIGFTWEHDLQLLYKRTKLDRFLFGLPTAWREQLAGLLQLSPGGAA